MNARITYYLVSSQSSSSQPSAECAYLGNESVKSLSAYFESILATDS